MLTKAFDIRIVKFEGLNANISSFEYLESDKILAICTNKGHINLYRCEDSSQGIGAANFYLKEDFNCVEKPHGNLDKTEDDAESTAKLYSYKTHKVSVKFMLSQRSQYCYILESLQYIYVRDYERAEVGFGDPAEVHHHDGQFPAVDLPRSVQQPRLGRPRR